MASYIFEGKLKQITPMIHFQAEEPGACLKPSEVKPKLDRFIRAQVEKKGESIPENWIIHKGEKNGHIALNYKIKFTAIDNDKVEMSGEKKYMRDHNWNRTRIPKEDSIHGNYFGNRLNKKDKNPESADLKIKDTVYYGGGIKLQIICFNEELMSVIQQHLRGFFLVHNFGTRQHKGFGSFVLIDNDALSIESDIDCIKKYIQNFYYVGYKDELTYKDVKDDVLNDISNISSLMKSGYNCEDDYFKGYIFHYFHKKYSSILNDKKVMKGMLLNEGKTAKGKAVFARSMLGLQDSYSFPLDPRNSQIKWNNAKISVSPKKSNDIERFNNPILFKPIGMYLLMIPLDIPKILFDREFVFEAKNSRKRNRREILVENSNGGSISNYDRKCSKCNKIAIRTPAKFDLIDFMDQFMAYYNDKDTKVSPNNKAFKNISDTIAVNSHRTKKNPIARVKNTQIQKYSISET